MTGRGAMEPVAERLYGTAAPPPPRLRLRAGALTADLVDGGIRRLAWNGVEIVRGISFLIRDEAWGTLPVRLDDPVLERTDSGFRVGLNGTIEAEGARFAFAASIEGRADGTFSFAVEGRSDAEIVTNRAGFVVLHPAGFAGMPVTLLDVAEHESDAVFPESISPGQPFFDLRGLRYALAGAGTVTCLMDASLPTDPLGRFETEDQRNWCDASFKTYVGSLLHPWPYGLPAGEPFRQQVTVSVDATDGGPAAAADASAASRVDALPRFAIAVPHGADKAPPTALAAVRGLRMPWAVIEADMRRADLPDHLSAAARLTAGRGTQVEIVAPAVSSPADELAAAAVLCAQAGLRPDAVLVVPAPLLKSFQPSGPWPDLPPLEEYYAAARSAFPGAAVGGGMMTNFTELNRKRPDPANLAFIAHGTTAIVHDADDEAVMETLETLVHIGHRVRDHWPGVPWHLGPSSIAMRSNPYGATEPRNPDWLRMPLADRDPRQRGLFGAAWTVGYAAAATEAGAAMVCLHASHGFLGLGDETGLWPCFHVMAALARASGQEWAELPVGTGLASLAWRDGTGKRGVVANLTAEEQPLGLTGPGRVLDVSTVAEARGDAGWIDGTPEALPAVLGPYAVAFVTG
ncbi:hypothetical protein [uncultured Alsobacter sp.]|uniref:hypothetical protein n=1 Tax=uncultured Alsobacter sp. TaxID=1748258 RepID=UPI0025FAE71F|nr:hypothetical protein [uncultured Alsobacter sp.]